MYSCMFLFTILLGPLQEREGTVIESWVSGDSMAVVFNPKLVPEDELLRRFRYKFGREPVSRHTCDLRGGERRLWVLIK